MTLERNAIITELILAGASEETIELARYCPLEDLAHTLQLQRALTRVKGLNEEIAISRQLAMRSRFDYE